jgi:hypothetical protein
MRDCAAELRAQEAAETKAPAAAKK